MFYSSYVPAFYPTSSASQSSFHRSVRSCSKIVVLCGQLGSGSQRDGMAPPWKHPVSILVTADAIDFLLDGQLIQTPKRQAQEQADPSFEQQVGIAKCVLNLLLSTFGFGGIGYAPMRRHRLPRPDGTRFLGRIIANGEDKTHFRRP